MDGAACESLKTRTLFHFLRKNGKLDEYQDLLLGKLDREELIMKYDLQKEIDKVMNAEISDETYPKILEQIRGHLGH